MCRDLRAEVNLRYRMLFDMTALDERLRRHRDSQAASDFTVVYHFILYHFILGGFLQERLHTRGLHSMGGLAARRPRHATCYSARLPS